MSETLYPGGGTLLAKCGPLRRVALLYGWNNFLSTLKSQGRKHLASIKLSDVCPLRESSTAAETTG